MSGDIPSAHSVHIDQLPRSKEIHANAKAQEEAAYNRIISADETAGKYLGSADNFRRSTQALNESGGVKAALSRSPVDWIDRDGAMQELSVATSIATNPDRAQSDSPYYRHDLLVHESVVETALHDQALYSVDWQTLANPNAFEKTGKPPGEEAIKTNIDILRNRVRHASEAALNQGDLAKGHKLWQRYQKMTAQVDLLDEPSGKNDAIKNYYDTYTNDPLDAGEIKPVEDLAREKITNTKVRREALSGLAETLGEMGHAIKPPIVADEQGGPLTDASHIVGTSLKQAYENVPAQLEADQSFVQWEKEHLEHLEHELGSATDKLANRNSTFLKKVGGAIVDRILKLETPQAQYEQAHQAYRRELTRTNPEGDANFLKKQHERLLKQTDAHAKWSMDHNFTSWLLRDNDFSKTARFIAFGLGTSAIVLASPVAIPFGTFLAAGITIAATLASRDGHEAVRGTLSTRESMPDLQGVTDNDEIQRRNMKHYNKRVRGELTRRAFISALGAPAQGAIHLLDRPKKKKKDEEAGGGGHH